MVRWLLKISVAAALVWGGWWWVATTGMQRSVTAWLEERRAEEIEARVDALSRSGFPMRTATVVQGMQLSDQARGSTLHLPQFTLSTPIYWPGNPTLLMPAGPIGLTTPQGQHTLGASGIEAGMELHPGAALQLEALRARAANLVLDVPLGRVFTADAVQLDLRQAATPQTYQLDLATTGFALGAVFRDGLESIPATWPETFEPVVAQMSLTFDRP